MKAKPIPPAAPAPGEFSSASGLSGVSIFGESSPFHTNAEFNYLALEYFADRPEATSNDFIYDVMAPRLGGVSRAEYYYEIAALHENTAAIPDAVSKISTVTADLSDYDQLRRWQYIASFLNGYYYEERERGAKAEFKASDNIGGL